MMSDLLSQDEINALLSADGGSQPEGDMPDSVGGSVAPQDRKALKDISSVFVSSLQSVFGMLTGKGVSVSVLDESCSKQSEIFPALAPDPFVLRARSSGLGKKPLAIIVPQRGGQILSDMMMGGEGKDLSGTLSELDSSAAQEGISQVMGSAFTNLSGMLKGERLIPEDVTANVETGEWTLFPQNEEMDVCSVKLRISIADVSDFDSWIILSQEFVRAFGDAQALAQTAPAAQSAQKAAPAQPGYQSQPQPQMQQQPMAYNMPGLQQHSPMVDVRPAEFSPISAKGATGVPSRIDLVSDIPVRVTVELGRTRKNISEILNMSAGAIIELDKMAGESVDVLVNGKLIAKGEVVVIDENFGVRVTEIVSVTSKTY